MHYEKKLCKNIIKTILEMKDSIDSRQDMESMTIQPKLWLQATKNGHNKFHMTEASYILNAAKKTTIMEIIKALKTPTNYVGAIHKCIEEGLYST